MTSIFSNRQRLLTSTSGVALTGCGIPGSNCVEGQPRLYRMVPA
jgi:hypothetical protein